MHTQVGREFTEYIPYMISPAPHAHSGRQRVHRVYIPFMISQAPRAHSDRNRVLRVHSVHSSTVSFTLIFTAFTSFKS